MMTTTTAATLRRRSFPSSNIHRISSLSLPQTSRACADPPNSAAAAWAALPPQGTKALKWPNASSWSGCAVPWATRGEQNSRCVVCAYVRQCNTRRLATRRWDPCTRARAQTDNFSFRRGRPALQVHCRPPPEKPARHHTIASNYTASPPLSQPLIGREGRSESDYEKKLSIPKHWALFFFFLSRRQCLWQPWIRPLLRTRWSSEVIRETKPRQ